uniref:Cytochrome c oxidase subunit 2 n=1 Tax=Rectidens sumatrensis TaxID=1903498 RepID=A0A8A3WP54_9BIVA|nr:cytochrome c oxidase subunit 2 [Rectidens sumatrensis]
MSYWGQCGLQEASSVLGGEVIGLYDHMMLVLVLVSSFVGWVMLKILWMKSFGRVYLDGNLLEFFWTVVPVFLLCCLGLPSIKLLYLMDEVVLPEVTVKIEGHQWYWSYEYSDIRGMNYSYDSYMVNNLVEEGDFRLLEVDNRCVVVRMVVMRGLVTSGDVIHSWAVPSAGVKVDGVPGRINQVSLCFTNTGVFYGQCSELCGVNHSFMPICVECVTVSVYTEWVMDNLDAIFAKMNKNGHNWSFWGVVFGILGGLGKGAYWLIKWYLTYLYSLFYYSFYVPAKFLVTSSWSLLKWAVSSGVALVKWFWWFSNSPVEALWYAVGYVVSNVWSAVVFVVLSPVKAAVFLVKGVFSGVVGFFTFVCYSLEAVISSMSSFTSDEFHEYVMREVNYNTKKFIWILGERYSSR